MEILYCITVIILVSIVIGGLVVCTYIEQKYKAQSNEASSKEFYKYLNDK